MTTEVQRFQLDPLKYVTNTCINLQTGAGYAQVGAFDANKAYNTCYFKLTPWSSSLFSAASQVILEPQSTFEAGLLTGFYVPYLAYGTITSNNANLVPLDNVSATAPIHKYIFTGGQNGCSLLLLNGTTPGTVCALHYPNSTGKAEGYPLLARIGRTAADIILAIDFDLYGEDQNPNACSFFYHNGTEWVGVTQPQVQGPANISWKRASMSLNPAMKPIKVSTSSIGTI